jgi:hypothetical protein
MNTKQIAKLKGRIKRIKKSLAQIGEMRPGSLSRQYNVCGNPTCRCKHPKNPQRHGPYCQISYTHNGKSKSEFVKKEMVGEVKKQLKNYHTFRRLTREWVELSLEIVRLRREEAKARREHDQDS